MTRPKRWRSVTCQSLMWISAYLMIILEGSFVSVVAQTRNLTPAPAAVLLQKDGTYDFGGQLIRCQRGETVGIWAESGTYLSITNVVVEGCEIGIVVTGAATKDAPGDAAQGLSQRSSGHVQGVRVRHNTIGIFLAGSASTASNNIVGETTYGIVVTGNDNIVTENQSNDNTKDGFLVTGDRNLLEGNEARRNGGVGIHVASVLPIVGVGRFVSFIQDRGLANVIRGNTALDNRRDLVEFAENCEDPFPGNQWISNVFATRRPTCIQ